MAALIRPRTDADLPACVGALRATHEASGYPARWPLFVAPAARGRGVGAALLAAAVDFVRANASRPVLTVADSGDTAIRLYERAGWRRIGEHRAEWHEPDGRHPTVYDYILDAP